MAATAGAVLLMLTAMTGCGDQVADEPDTGTAPSASDSSTPDMMTEMTDTAKRDLAERLDVDEADIKVVSADAVTWTDGSLGCPEPGMMYTQALVEGNRIILEAKQQEYSYHAGKDHKPFLCEHPKSPGAGTK